MTTSAKIDDLEEILALKSVPCGGNQWPVTRPCPARAEAVMVSTHICVPRPANYKCQACYNEWRRAIEMSDSPLCSCRYCANLIHYMKAYRPL